MLTQYTATIAIDTTGTATYSDMISTYGIYSKLNNITNWRFYINTLNNFAAYISKINVVHTYANIGLYTINIVFLNISNITLQQIVNITDCKK
jgi:hypothetical protein